MRWYWGWLARKAVQKGMCGEFSHWHLRDASSMQYEYDRIKSTVERISHETERMVDVRMVKEGGSKSG